MSNTEVHCNAKEEIEMEELNESQRSGELNSDDLLTVTDSEEDIIAFNDLVRKYHEISRKIRLDAICKEKEELEKMDEFSEEKYFVEPKNERIQALDEEKRLLETAESTKLKVN